MSYFDCLKSNLSCADLIGLPEKWKLFAVYVKSVGCYEKVTLVMLN